MELLKQPPTGQGPAEMFAGDVWFDVIYRGEEPSRARVNVVKFAPGARTAWHSHGLGRPCTSSKASPWSSPGAARSSRRTPATSSTPRPARSTGTAPPPTGS